MKSQFGHTWAELNEHSGPEEEGLSAEIRIGHVGDWRPRVILMRSEVGALRKLFALEEMAAAQEHIADQATPEASDEGPIESGMFTERPPAREFFHWDGRPETARALRAKSSGVDFAIDIETAALLVSIGSQRLGTVEKDAWATVIADPLRIESWNAEDFRARFVRAE